ncbi:ABC transporter substrate-binding protein [Demequina litorisediminis]|nr:extracellular solute-binding protein [Demequina litorisediminis]
MIRTSTRVTTAAAVTALATLGLAACTGATDEADTTTISYLSWNSEADAQPVIDAFEAEHPDITVDLAYSPPVAEYIQTLQTRIAGGQAPDVFRIAPENRATLISENLVADLSDLSFVDTLADANRTAYTSDDKALRRLVRGLGRGSGLQQGPARPGGRRRGTYRLGRLPRACATPSRMRESPPTSSPPPSLSRIFQGFLGDGYAADGNAVGEAIIFDGESTFAEEWPEPMTQWMRIYDEGIVGAETISLTGDQVRDEFVAGNVAMYITGPWDLATLDESGIDYGMTFQPGIGGENVGAGASDPGFAISSSAEGAELEAAKEFVEWLATPEALALQSEHWGSMSTSTAYDTEVNPAYTQALHRVAQDLAVLPVDGALARWRRAAAGRGTGAAAVADPGQRDRG